MTILGIDFTSKPTPRKPITCARTRLDGDLLSFVDLVHWNDFEQFESALETPGPWIAGTDFPFGQARRLIENMRWPLDWAGYVRLVASLDRAGFRDVLEDYKRDRAFGDKQHKRTCDVISRSQSPQTLYGTPVALMFFEGARRLLRAGVHLPHNHDGDRTRIVVEAYPGVAARSLIGGQSYKNDTKKKQTDAQRQARREIFASITGEKGRAIYGFSIDAPEDLAEDPGGDNLDAFLCAVQAAWGWSRRSDRFGAPPGHDRLEGWIADPTLLDSPRAARGRTAREDEC